MAKIPIQPFSLNGDTCTDVTLLVNYDYTSASMLVNVSYFNLSGSQLDYTHLLVDRTIIANQTENNINTELLWAVNNVPNDGTITPQYTTLSGMDTVLPLLFRYELFDTFLWMLYAMDGQQMETLLVGTVMDCGYVADFILTYLNISRINTADTILAEDGHTVLTEQGGQTLVREQVINATLQTQSSQNIITEDNKIITPE